MNWTYTGQILDNNRANGGGGFSIFAHTVRARAKQLGFTGQLYVDFKSDNRFKFHKIS